jgi:uroporphyrinogen decarboxylase
MPDGMAILGSVGGPCEWLMWIMGYETLSLALADDPELVSDVVDCIERQMLAVFRHVAAMERVGAMWISDDMGFRTGTFLSPAHMRAYVLPTQRRLAAAAHAEGIPVLLHSCGNLTAIMDDLIDDVGIDAKHSFEDVITPVTEAKKLWGHRVCLIGGVDLDPLTRLSPEEVYRYTLGILEKCAPGGGYILGTGNSVANYVPIPNYLSMLQAWRDWHVTSAT